MKLCQLVHNMKLGQLVHHMKLGQLVINMKQGPPLYNMKLGQHICQNGIITNLEMVIMHGCQVIYYHINRLSKCL